LIAAVSTGGTALLFFFERFHQIQAETAQPLHGIAGGSEAAEFMQW